MADKPLADVFTSSDLLEAARLKPPVLVEVAQRLGLDAKGLMEEQGVKVLENRILEAMGSEVIPRG